jgi:hypothetical protein
MCHQVRQRSASEVAARDHPALAVPWFTLDLKRVGAVSLPFNYQAINVLGPIAQCTL